MTGERRKCLGGLGYPHRPRGFYPIVKVMLVFTALGLFGHLDAHGQRAPRVLIDASLEFTFAWSTDWWEGTLAQSYLRPLGFGYTLSQKTLDSAIFHYDVLVLEQTATNIQVTKPLARLLQSYVNDGGGLLLVGKGWAWQTYAPHQPNERYPLDYLASFFGIKFATEVATKPYRVLSHEITSGVSTFDNGGSSAGVLSLPSGAEVLVEDNQGKVLVGALRYGNGRVLVLAENDCLAPQLPGTPRNITFLQNAITWLAAGMAARDTGVPIPYRIYPESTITLGGATLLYAASLGARTHFLLDKFSNAYNRLRGLMGTELGQSLKVVALATGGGGYSGEKEIGVGVLASDYYTVAVLAHELTHSWVLPGYEEFWMGEGWASLAAIRVTASMGYESDARAERTSYDRAFRQVDPAGTQLDLSTSVHAYEPGYAAGPVYMGKGMWVIETLENQYRADLMKRYVQLKRKYLAEGTSMSTDRTVYYLSLAAGDDLYAYFQSIGTSTLSPKPVLPVVYLTRPEANEDSVSITAPILITFSNSIDCATLNASTISITGSKSRTIPGGLSYLDSAQTVVFTPTTVYQPGETIKVRVSNALRDAHGNPLDGNGNGIAEGSNDTYVFTFKVTMLTGVEKVRTATPMVFRLHQNHPNPFNRRTRVSYVLLRPEQITLKVYDSLGRNLATLVNEMKSEGQYEVDLDMHHLPSGIYYYKLLTSDFADYRSMILVR